MIIFIGTIIYWTIGICCGIQVYMDLPLGEKNDWITRLGIVIGVCIWPIGVICCVIDDVKKPKTDSK